jgi:hypothetical protein
LYTGHVAAVEIRRDPHRRVRVVEVIPQHERQRPTSNPPAGVDLVHGELGAAEHGSDAGVGEAQDDADLDRTAIGTAGREPAGDRQHRQKCAHGWAVK